MEFVAVIISGIIELIILGKFLFSLLDTRLSKSKTIILFVISGILNVFKCVALNDEIAVNVISTIALHIALMFALFKGEIFKKIIVYLVYIVSSGIALVLSEFFVYFIYGEMSNGVSGGIVKYMWYIAAWLFVFALSTVGCIFLKRKYGNSENTAIQYIYLYLAIQGLILTMFYMLIIKHRIVSFVMLAVSAFVIVVSIAIGALIYKTVRAAAFSRAEAEFIRREDAIKDKHIIEIESQYSQYEELRRYFYDYVEKLEKTDDCRKVKEYTKDIRSGFDLMEQVSFCNNLALDALLLIKRTEAREKGIDISYEICDCENTGISDFDLCTVVSNLLDNAVEASAQTDEKYIRFKINKKINKLVISVVNSSPEVHPSLKTKKSDSENHGFGIKNIEYTATKNGGDSTFKYDNGEFVSVVTMDCEF